jgi:amidase
LGPTPEVFFQQLASEGPMARTVPDVAMLLAVQSGFDARAPLSIDQDPAIFTRPLQRDHQGMRIGWMGDFNGYLPTDPGVMALCEKALAHFDTIGCRVEAVQPDFSMERLWQCWLTMRGFFFAGYYSGLYARDNKRCLLKPEVIWEIEQGMALSAAQVWRAAIDRSAWYQALNLLYQTYDFLVLPSAQVFPFDAGINWPKSISGTPMDTYHRWMESMVAGTLASGPVLNVPAGFGPGGLPMGLQILGPPRADLSVLQLGYAYEQACGYAKIRSPLLG